MKFQLLVIVATLAWTGLCAVNEPCIGEGGKPGMFSLSSMLAWHHYETNALNSGVCIEASKCTSSGGKSISNACPKDAKDVKCCTKPTCGTGDNKGKGNCSWQSDCAGSSISNQCPGPAQMKCCLSSGNGFGGYSSPKIPPVGACKRVAVDGAGKIVKQFPGRVRQVFCTRDCKPGDRPSDHCTGKATDMMCSDGGGVSFFSLAIFFFLHLIHLSHPRPFSPSTSCPCFLLFPKPP